MHEIMRKAPIRSLRVRSCPYQILNTTNVKMREVANRVEMMPPFMFARPAK
jgi:hypothetical protein